MKTILTSEQIARAERLIHRLTVLTEITASDVRELLAAEFLDLADRDLLLAYETMISIHPNFSLPATVDCAAAGDLPTPVDHARLIVGLLPSGLVWCIKRGTEIINEGKAETFAEIRGIQVHAGIWDVSVGGLNRPDAHEAARQYNWAPKF